MLPPLGIKIFRRVRFCPRSHTSLLLKSKRLFTKYKFQAVNFSLWKSRPETGAIAATICVRCEDNLYRPAVEGYLPLVATPALHKADTPQDDILSNRDPIEIERRVVLLVNSQDFRTSDDDPIMGAQEIPYRDRNIKFHRDPIAVRPDAAESKVPIFCRIGKDRLPIELKLYFAGARRDAQAQGKRKRH